MSTRNDGNVSISVTAGTIRATSQPIHPELGKQVAMGDDLYFHITPEIARQWIDVLTTITKESKA